MKLTEMFPSKYLKADDLDSDTPVIIANIKFERMQSEDGKEEDKPVLYFLRVEKGLVLNKTNATIISEQHGDDTDNWNGKKITLTKERVTAFGKSQWAIRVKAIAPQSGGSGALKGAMEAVPDPAEAFGGNG